MEESGRASLSHGPLDVSFASLPPPLLQECSPIDQVPVIHVHSVPKGPGGAESILCQSQFVWWHGAQGLGKQSVLLLCVIKK